MDPVTLAAIISSVLAIVAALAGAYLFKAKGIIKRTMAFLETLDVALDDNKLSADEMKSLIAKAIAIIKGDTTEEK